MRKSAPKCLKNGFLSSKCAEKCLFFTFLGFPTILECQKQHDAGGKGLIKGGFIPECTETGEFKPLQCEQGRRECFCVNKEGIEVPNSRSKPGQAEPDCESEDLVSEIFLIYSKNFSKNIFF